MKDHIHLFVIYTLLEVSFTALYVLVAQTVDATVFIGALLYTASMLSIYFSYRQAQRKKQKQDLLDAFLSATAARP